jgi:hypothetical protein
MSKVKIKMNKLKTITGALLALNKAKQKRKIAAITRM